MFVTEYALLTNSRESVVFPESIYDVYVYTSVRLEHLAIAQILAYRLSIETSSSHGLGNQRDSEATTFMMAVMQCLQDLLP